MGSTDLLATAAAEGECPRQRCGCLTQSRVRAGGVGSGLTARGLLVHHTDGACGEGEWCWAMGRVCPAAARGPLSL
jgi:hypothetical protein